MKWMTAFLAAAGLAAPAWAEDGDWRYRATLYGWFPAMDTAIETRFGTIEQNASSADVLNALDGVFMATFSAQNGNWGLVGDFLYADLGASVPTPLPLFDSATIGVELTAVSGYALYRISQSGPVQFDIGAGFRHFNLGVDAGLTRGNSVPRSQSISDSWTDPLIAARLMVPLDVRWFLTGFADFGGSGADNQTWQAYGGLGYNFNDAWSMQVGWRHMDLTHRLEGRDVNIGLSGGLVGVTYSF